MLLEEQAAELLRRCESVVGSRLEQIRGNLKNSETRSAAVWELIVLEEASRIGKVEYEPYESGSPDIRLTLRSGRKIWIEVAFLYPRFWKQERQSRVVTGWITNEAIRRKIPPFKVFCRFDGDQKNIAGSVRLLPNLHEKKQFLSEPDVIRFFNTIEESPKSAFSIKHSMYSIEISYLPQASGPYLSTGGLVQEAPGNVKEHAVYRVLRGKAKQHDVDGVRLVCVGSDQSPALSSVVRPGNPTVRDAIYAAFRRNRSLSGAIILRIEDSVASFGEFKRIAKGDIYVNPIARTPIEESDLLRIQQLDFNCWNYYFRMEKYEQKNIDSFRRISGPLNMSIKDFGVGIILEVPGDVLIASLAGKTNLKKEYPASSASVLRCLDQGWIVKSCSWKAGDIEKGEAPKVILELEPPPEAVYWPEKKTLNKPIDNE